MIIPYKTINLKYYNSAGEQSQQSEQCPIPPVFEMLGEGIGCGIAVEFVTERGANVLHFALREQGSTAGLLPYCQPRGEGYRVFVEGVHPAVDAVVGRRGVRCHDIGAGYRPVRSEPFPVPSGEAMGTSFCRVGGSPLGWGLLTRGVAMW